MASIKQIEAFYWTVQLGTLERAAAKLYITQSAATKRLQELEKYSCSPIFNKNGHKTSITAKGEELFQLTETLLERLALLSELRNSEREIARSLRIGITELATATWFGSFVEKMSVCHPQISISPDVDSSEHLQKKLVAGELDIIVVGTEYITPVMQCVPLKSYHLTWIAPSNSRLSDGIYTVADLAEFPIVIQGPESVITQRCELLFSDAGYDFKRIYGSNSIYALIGLVKAGVGISCVPRIIFERESMTGVLTTIQTASLPDPIEFNAAFLKVTNGLPGYAIADIIRQCMTE